MPAARKKTKTPRKRLQKRTVLIEITLPGIGQKESFEAVKTVMDDVTDRLTAVEFEPPCKFFAMYNRKKCGEVAILNQAI